MITFDNREDEVSEFNVPDFSDVAVAGDGTLLAYVDLSGINIYDRKSSATTPFTYISPPVIFCIT